MTDEEEFFAWLDGELAPADAARVAARVAQDPALGAQADSHRAIADQLREAFDPVMTARSEVADLSARRAERVRRVPAGLPQWAAIAATLVAGFGLGSVVNANRDDASPVVLDGGRLVAAAALDRTLTRQLASVDQRRDAMRIGLTFRNAEGGLCRTFSASAASGLACRDGAHWRIEGLYGAGGASGGDYRMAAGADPRLAALVDGTIRGEPLDAAAEAAAMKSGWR